jgi:hypothetical protein
MLLNTHLFEIRLFTNKYLGKENAWEAGGVGERVGIIKSLIYA